MQLYCPMWFPHSLLTPLQIVLLLNTPQITQFECTICPFLDCGQYKVIYKDQSLGNIDPKKIILYSQEISLIPQTFQMSREGNDKA